MPDFLKERLAKTFYAPLFFYLIRVKFNKYEWI